jgi:Arc/MetJ-type ribon-helix-helix transcriptional regulator
MTVAKITVSLPEGLARGARRAVELGYADSMSAFVARAMAAELEERDFSLIIDEVLDATGGPLTPEETDWADTQLDTAAVAECNADAAQP